MRMLVDIFMAPVGPSQAPKMDPVVPNLMSASVGSRPARAGAVVAARAAVETTKRRRLSMALSRFFSGRLYQAQTGAKHGGRALQRNKSGNSGLLRQKAGDAGGRRFIKNAV